MKIFSINKVKKGCPKCSEKKTQIQKVALYMIGRDWTSPTQIGIEALGKPENHNGKSPASKSACNVLKRLVCLGIIARNRYGCYRDPDRKRRDAREIGG